MVTNVKCHGNLYIFITLKQTVGRWVGRLPLFIYNSNLAVETSNTLNLAALKRSEVLSFFARLQWLVSARSMYLEDSIFQRTVHLYATESFINRVLKRGNSSESRALIEYDRSRFFAIQLIRVLGSLPS